MHQLFDFPKHFATGPKYKKRPVGIQLPRGPYQAPRVFLWEEYLENDNKMKPVYVYVRRTDDAIEIFGNRLSNGNTININGRWKGPHAFQRMRPAGELMTPGYDDRPLALNPWYYEVQAANQRADKSPITRNGVTFSGNQETPTTISEPDLVKLDLTHRRRR